MISPYSLQGEGEVTTKAVIEISLAAKKHWELEVKILREAPRDANKYREIIKVKQEEYEEAEDSEDIERLIPEMEMLKFVLYVYRESNSALF